MGRCQYCDKLTHSEDVNVYFKQDGFDKIFELSRLKEWLPRYAYSNHETPSNEYGKLKCGDIILHFIKLEEEDEKKISC
jgi:hypothetical protein